MGESLMGKSRTNLLLALLVLLAAPAFAELRSLTIIHTNDLHGHIQQTDEFAGAARIAALVDQTRQSQPGVLVLDAGDSISGTPVSTLFQGLPIFSILSKAGYNIGALGNHEFDHGYKKITEFRQAAAYPLLSANALAPDGSLIADNASLLVQVNGIRVAVIGLITADTPHIITPTGNMGLVFLSPEDTLRAQVQALQPLADLVVVLSHVGHSEERRLAAAVSDIDIIIGGHSHTRVDPPVKVNNTWVVQAGYYGSHVGYLELQVDTDKHQLVDFAGQLISAADLPAADAGVAKLVAHWEQEVADIVDRPIASSDRDYSPAELQPILEAILRRQTGADFGFYNMGGIRDKIRQGTITVRNIWNIEPFGNSVVTITANGAAIRGLLEKDGGRQAYMADIIDDQQYRLATNSFVAAHAQQAAPQDISLNDSQLLVRDVLVDYIRDHGLSL